MTEVNRWFTPAPPSFSPSGALQLPFSFPSPTLSNLPLRPSSPPLHFLMLMLTMHLDGEPAGRWHCPELGSPYNPPTRRHPPPARGPRPHPDLSIHILLPHPFCLQHWLKPQGSRVHYKLCLRHAKWCNLSMLFLTRYNAVDVSLGFFGTLEPGAGDLQWHKREGALNKHSELMSKLGCKHTNHECCSLQDANFQPIAHCSRLFDVLRTTLGHRHTMYISPPQDAI